MQTRARDLTITTETLTTLVPAPHAFVPPLARTCQCYPHMSASCISTPLDDARQRTQTLFNALQLTEVLFQGDVQILGTSVRQRKLHPAEHLGVAVGHSGLFTHEAQQTRLPEAHQLLE
jgi:hypothetical protein